MTPQQFIAKWGPGGPAFDLNERQGAQHHFIDLCQLLGVPSPGSAGDYIFEQDTLVLGEARGYADVFYRDHFAWENKAPGRNLDAALKQLLTYSLALSNPPLLVVCDRLTTRIHTQFNGHPSEVHTVFLHELDQPEKLALLRRLWTDPESFRPKKTSRDITEMAAKSFATLAEGLRRRGQDADEVAHFLTQCLFCFFAEDVGLLPGRMFEGLVNNKHLTSDKLTAGLTNLFTVMRDGGLYGNDDIPWFNGGLFQRVKVPALTIMEVTELRNAAALNWSAIDVSIFGTLFERGLDPSKRSQLGAHYTDPATILRIIEPVLTRPLLQKWELLAQEIRGLMAKSTKKASPEYKLIGQRTRKASAGDAPYQKARLLFAGWLEDLKAYRVLDPACGSGNFLFLGLKALKDIEHKSHLDAAALGLDRQADLVTGPHNVLGIELNEYAAELARVTVWIGELQWRIEHGYDFKTNPVLEPLDHIECRDALLSFAEDLETGADSGARREDVGDARASEENGVRSEFRTTTLTTTSNVERNSALTPFSVVAGGKIVTEASWPMASIVIGNPPFLGDKMMRSELGDDYTNTLRAVYKDRVPGGADLVMFWFEKARTQIERSGLGDAGLVATNSIRQRGNRPVMERIQTTTRIYEAWADMPWVNEGAAVRVSLVCFGHAGQTARLDGEEVQQLFPDLKAQAAGASEVDLTTAQPLSENAHASFFGLCLAGPFKVSGETVSQWLMEPNVNGLSNSEVLRPIYNGSDITRRWAGNWTVDFGARMSEEDAAQFERPFEFAKRHVYPIRVANNRASRAKYWWRHGEARPGLRTKLAKLDRYIATVETAKHRFFVFFPVSVAPEHSLIVIPRADDTTLGLLSSRMHVVWALARGGRMGKGNDPRYNSLAAFEPFPFPAGLTPADTAHQRTETLENGAVIPALEGLGIGPAEMGVRAEFRSASLVSEQAVVPNWQNPKSTDLTPISAAPSLIASPTLTAAPPASFSDGIIEQNTAVARIEPAQAATKHVAISIAIAAKRLNELRENWLNPREWTVRVPEVIPLGMDTSPYPDRILPKAGHEKDLAERTLTKLYNLSPAWLIAAHKALDVAVAQAYGWSDYTADMTDEEILKRLLALNLQRSDRP